MFIVLINNSSKENITMIWWHKLYNRYDELFKALMKIINNKVLAVKLGR